ncbi:hypothetical protein CANARDRAFT_27044 [[Candida] arabinofermentans NRRL YB-2248]|uniref:Sm domain-containing protein n=1 Tax=[Candida] arabinofermentans NRRL YB-2248 TaxID=983967 RepID=A0A1E4T4D1_9ASCO|nr:hypothetical protein CANARDRAFT_27044 [[Candida] arabinofermentans NRRL YB-2248]
MEGQQHHQKSNNSNSYNNNNNNNNRQRNNQKKDKLEGPKREAILNLQRFQDKRIIVTFIGGRKVTGTLKGFDQLMNLVLDDSDESIRDPSDNRVFTGETRKLGLVVVRGPLLLTISPVEGFEVIDNPFNQPEEEQPTI